MQEHQISFMNTVPSILIKKDNDMDIVTDGEVKVGDVIKYAITTMGGSINVDVKVIEIIEQRPPKGDWTGDSYKRITPIWNRIKVSNYLPK